MGLSKEFFEFSESLDPLVVDCLEFFKFSVSLLDDLFKFFNLSNQFGDLNVAESDFFSKSFDFLGLFRNGNFD